MECCTTSFFNCCLASNINLVLLGTYVIAKDPHFNPFCVWGQWDIHEPASSEETDKDCY